MVCLLWAPHGDDRADDGSAAFSPIGVQPFVCSLLTFVKDESKRALLSLALLPLLKLQLQPRSIGAAKV